MPTHVHHAVSRAKGVRCVAMFGLAVVVSVGGRAWAEDVAAPALKAAFLFNFVKFAQWPADVVPPAATLVLCIVNDDQVATALESLTRGRPVDDHEVVVKRLTVDGPIRNCQMLYISGAGAKQAIAVAQSLQNTPALTVSDLSGFAQSGGMVNFVVADGKLRFVINVDAAARARLSLSSKLLSLATIVKEQ